MIHLRLSLFTQKINHTLRHENHIHELPGSKIGKKKSAIAILSLFFLTVTKASVQPVAASSHVVMSAQGKVLLFYLLLHFTAQLLNTFYIFSYRGSFEH